MLLAQLAQPGTATLRPVELLRGATARVADQGTQAWRQRAHVVLARDAEPVGHLVRGALRLGLVAAVLADALVDLPRRVALVERALERLHVPAGHRRGREPERARLIRHHVGSWSGVAVVAVVAVVFGLELAEAIAQQRPEAVGLGAVLPDLRRELVEAGRRRTVAGRLGLGLRVRDPLLHLAGDDLQARQSLLERAELLGAHDAPLLLRLLGEALQPLATPEQGVEDAVLAQVDRLELGQERGGVDSLRHADHPVCAGASAPSRSSSKS